jgi:hypothetical protein
MNKVSHEVDPKRALKLGFSMETNPFAAAVVPEG